MTFDNFSFVCYDSIMDKVISIPRELVKEGELVLIPRSEYEDYLRLKKIIPLVAPTPREKRSIERGREQIRKGKRFSLQELKDALAA